MADHEKDDDDDDIEEAADVGTVENKLVDGELRLQHAVLPLRLYSISLAGAPFEAVQRLLRDLSSVAAPTNAIQYLARVFGPRASLPLRVFIFPVPRPVIQDTAQEDVSGALPGVLDEWEETQKLTSEHRKTLEDTIGVSQASLRLGALTGRCHCEAGLLALLFTKRTRHTADEKRPMSNDNVCPIFHGLQRTRFSGSSACLLSFFLA